MSETNEKQTKKKLSRSGKFIINLILVVSLCVAAFSGYKLVTGLIGYKQADQKYETLQTEAKLPQATSTTTVKQSGIDWEYLKSQNANVAAWITLPDSVIDYPVTYAEDNSYYLTHLFDGTENYAGCVFVDCNNAHGFTDKNTVMYAHYMSNGEGRMFTALNNYADQSYYDTHKYLVIDTPTALYHMEVAAGIETTGTGGYIQLSFATPADFTSYVKSFTDNSTFKSDTTITENDQIITLSTCSPKNLDGRYALIGKLVKIEDYDK